MIVNTIFFNVLQEQQMQMRERERQEQERARILEEQLSKMVSRWLFYHNHIHLIIVIRISIPL